MDRETDTLAEAINNALDRGITPDEITDMLAAREPRTLNELAQHMGEVCDKNGIPEYTEPPPGMIDLATAHRDHGVNPQTARGWIYRGVLPVLGKVKGRGGWRDLVCEQTVAQMAKMPKNKGGRSRKTSISG